MKQYLACPWPQYVVVLGSPLCVRLCEYLSARYVLGRWVISFPRASINVFVFRGKRNNVIYVNRRPPRLHLVMESESVLQHHILPDDLPQDIHHSIADADDIEEVWDEDISV